MQRTSALVIGAGQAGLAMSHCLTARGIDHVVVERGRVAERWRSERWDSLRLLTPNWMTRLPGWSYRGADPHGFMTAAAFGDSLQAYAASFRAPVRDGVTVLSVRRQPPGYRVDTTAGPWLAQAVIVATGHADVPLVPGWSAGLPPDVDQLASSAYRAPGQLAPGGVLVVGASATGVQLAEELRRAGRPVALSVGRHIRLPRRYRGRDICDWLDRAGIFDERAEDVTDLRRARALPSFQLVGRPDGRSIDLGTLRRAGVRLLGRVQGVTDGSLQVADDLGSTMASAQAALQRLLLRIDAVADREAAPAAHGGEAATIEVDASPTRFDLAAEGIRTVLWATGFRREYPWLHVPVLDAAGEIVHRGGVTAAPGLFVLGLRLLRRRNSSFIDGVGRDAAELAADVEASLGAIDRIAA